MEHATFIPVTNTGVTQTDCPLERGRSAENNLSPTLWVCWKIGHRGAASVIHNSSRNHSFSPDKDLAVGSLHDEWSVGNHLTVAKDEDWGWTPRGEGTTNAFRWPDDCVFVDSMRDFDGPFDLQLNQGTFPGSASSRIMVRLLRHSKVFGQNVSDTDVCHNGNALYEQNKHYNQAQLLSLCGST